jgi:hypothetical protein
MRELQQRKRDRVRDLSVPVIRAARGGTTAAAVPPLCGGGGDGVTPRIWIPAREVSKCCRRDVCENRCKWWVICEKLAA